MNQQSFGRTLLLRFFFFFFLGLVIQLEINILNQLQYYPPPLEGVNMFEAKTFHNQRIIWQVDVAYVQRINATTQVIKVIAIFLKFKFFSLFYWLPPNPHALFFLFRSGLSAVTNMSTR